MSYNIRLATVECFCREKYNQQLQTLGKDYCTKMEDFTNEMD